MDAHAGSCQHVQRKNRKWWRDKDGMPTMSASNTNPGTHIRPHIKTIFTITSLNIFGKKKKKIKCLMLCLQQNKIQWHKFKQYRQVCNQSYKILSCLSPYSIPWGICSLYCFCFKWLLIIIPLNHIVIQGQLAPGEKKSHLKWTHLKWRSKFHSKWWLGDYLGNWN